jgi:hypothetical protein
LRKTGGNAKILPDGFLEESSSFTAGCMGLVIDLNACCTRALFRSGSVARSCSGDGAKAGAMVPTDAKVTADVKNPSCETNWTECLQLVGRYTTFQFFAYSLDYILPIIELDQKKKWAPRVVCETGSQKSCPLGVVPPLMEGRRISLVGVGIAILTLLENLFG